jgi:hypothetical protein
MYVLLFSFAVSTTDLTRDTGAVFSPGSACPSWKTFGAPSELEFIFSELVTDYIVCVHFGRPVSVSTFSHSR